MNLTMGTKIKLELKQPQFKCSGRDDVTCYYRGEILKEESDSYLIKFKHKGEWLVEWYDKKYGFDEIEIENIKMKE